MFIYLIFFFFFGNQVVIDDAVAFVGGIDLCFGRYDNGKYSVTDLQKEVYPGRDYVNSCRGSNSESNGPAMEEILDRKTVPRMPWHDVMMQCDGPVAKDVVFNFVQRWNFIKDKTNPTGMNYIMPLSSTENLIDMKEINHKAFSDCSCQVLRSIGEWSCGVPTEKSIYDAYIYAIQNAQHFIYIGKKNKH